MVKTNRSWKIRKDSWSVWCWLGPLSFLNILGIVGGFRCKPEVRTHRLNLIRLRLNTNIPFHKWLIDITHYRKFTISSVLYVLFLNLISSSNVKSTPRFCVHLYWYFVVSLTKLFRFVFVSVQLPVFYSQCEIF